MKAFVIILSMFSVVSADNPSYGIIEHLDSLNSDQDNSVVALIVLKRDDEPASINQNKENKNQVFPLALLQGKNNEDQLLGTGFLDEEYLRKKPFLSCQKAAIKICQKACQAAMKFACSRYDCKKKLKQSMKKECKSECKQYFMST